MWKLTNVGYSKDTIKELQKGIYQLDITIEGRDETDDSYDDGIAIYDRNKDIVCVSDKATIDEFGIELPNIEQELLDNLHTNWEE